MRRAAIASVMLLASSASFAEPGLRIGEATDQQRYADCLARIAADPEDAHEEALAWRYQGGGWPAEHCVSLALIGLGHFEPGGARLRAAAEGAGAASAQSRAIMFGQAGDAFLKAEAFAEAAEAFGRGLDFAPEDAGLALGVTEAQLKAERFVEAEATAARALDIVESADAYRLRGEARLALGLLDAAEADMVAARRLAPENVDVLLLRGKINEARRIDN